MRAAPLRGATVASGEHPAERHAARLLIALGARPVTAGQPDLWPRPRHATAEEGWSAGGGAALTGDADGPPLGGPAPVASAVDAAAAALEALSSALAARTIVERAVDVDGPALLAQRASATGGSRKGSTSVGGSCRLLPTADGWLAVSLPRQEDRELLPAWLARTGPLGWPDVTTAVRDLRAADLAVRGRMLGLPVAAVVRPHETVRDPQGRHRGLGWPVDPWIVRERSPADGTARPRPARVVDLSSLWAGPLATALLARAGMQVVKVESTRRPDGLRSGAPPLFDLLNHASRSVALDLRDPRGVDRLRHLIAHADVVVEGSRPRALDQLGCGPDELLGTTRPQVWLSITGYGRNGPWSQHPALGDDAAIAGGLAVHAAREPADPHRDPPRFCADAVADPAAGLHAALAVLACWSAGGTWHVDVAMREVAASLVPEHPEGVGPEPVAQPTRDGWELGGHPVRLPELPAAPAPAPALGAQTAEVLREVGA